MFRQWRENGIHKPIHKLLITGPGSTRQTVASKPIKIAHKYRQDPGYVKYSEIDIWNIPSDKMSGLRCLETCQSRKLYLFEIFGGSLEVLNPAFYGCTLLATFIGDSGCFGNVLGKHLAPDMISCLAWCTGRCDDSETSLLFISKLFIRCQVYT